MIELKHIVIDEGSSDYKEIKAALDTLDDIDDSITVIEDPEEDKPKRKRIKTNNIKA